MISVFINFNIILPGNPRYLFPSHFQITILYLFLIFPIRNIYLPIHSLWLYQPNNISWSLQTMKFIGHFPFLSHKDLNTDKITCYRARGNPKCIPSYSWCAGFINPADMLLEMSFLVSPKIWKFLTFGMAVEAFLRNCFVMGKGGVACDRVPYCWRIFPGVKSFGKLSYMCLHWMLKCGT